MTFSVLKRSTAACWAALKVMLDILVIGPAYVMALCLFFMALPSPGAFFLSEAEHLIRGTETGKVWGCEPTIKPLADETVSVSQAPPIPTPCIPKLESQAEFVADFNHKLFTFYKVIAALYALIYFGLRRRPARYKQHSVDGIPAMSATAPVKEVHHE
jgi:hypothetical protein